MSRYEEKPEDLTQDTKGFFDSDFGIYSMGILEEMANGYLSNAANVENPYTDRYLAKYSAIREVIESFKQPLDDDQRTGGL